MSPEGITPGNKAEIVGSYAEVRERRGGMLLPDPPIGQLVPEKIMSATPEDLAFLSEHRFGMPLGALLARSPNGVSEYSDERHPWTKDDLLKLALLSMDGKSPKEMADAFDKARPPGKTTVSENLISSVSGRSLSSRAQKLSETNRLIRKSHGFFAPESRRAEDELGKLEKVFGVPRYRMFRNPGERAGSPRASKRVHKHADSINQPDVAIHLMYSRFILKESFGVLARKASLMLGKEYKPLNVSGMFFKTLTEEAKAAFGMQRPKKGREKEAA